MEFLGRPGYYTTAKREYFNIISFAEILIHHLHELIRLKKRPFHFSREYKTFMVKNPPSVLLNKNTYRLKYPSSALPYIRTYMLKLNIS